MSLSNSFRSTNLQANIEILKHLLEVSRSCEHELRTELKTCKREPGSYFDMGQKEFQLNEACSM